MPEFEIDHIIYVGGCSGKAIEITETYIVVEGRYYFYDIEMEADPDLKIWEDWRYQYRIKDFAKVVWDEKSNYWNADGIPNECIYHAFGDNKHRSVAQSG